MGTVKSASNGPPRRRLLRGLSVLSLVVVLAFLIVSVATANPGVILDFSQWANKPLPYGGSWIFGIANEQKSTYHESDAVPQRFLYQAACVDGVPVEETLTIRYETTNSGKHAFDYLTNVLHSAPVGFVGTGGVYPTINDWLCTGYAGLGVGSTNCLNWTGTPYAIPQDPNVGTLDDYARDFTVLNGVITSVSPVTVFSGNYLGTSLSEMTLTFKAATCADTRVLIAFAAHVASEKEWKCTACGAFSISGAPYHVMTINGGSRDNQLSSSAVVGSVPEIRICKEVLGPYTDNHVFDFRFKDGGAPVTFGLKNQECNSFAGLTASDWPHSWTIEELSQIGTSYKFSRVICSVLDGASFTPFTGGTYGGTITLNTTASYANCTFYNSNLTSVKLAGFNGRAAGGQVTLDWQTGTETNNAGFNILRAKSAAGPWVQVNSQLIAASGDATAGAAYSYKDKPGYGAFFYKLEDVDLSGQATAHGPVQVTLVFPFRRPPQPPAPPAQ